MAGTGIMVGICTSRYPSPYPIEKVGNSPYPYPTETGSDNTHEGKFICHLYSQLSRIRPTFGKVNPDRISAKVDLDRYLIN